MNNILVTGSGGISGVNFVRALKITDEEFTIIGTDFSKYYLQFPDLDVRVRSARHSDPEWIELIKDLTTKLQIEFVHAGTSVVGCPTG